MERDVGFPYDALHKSDKMLIYVVIVIYCAMFNAYIHDTHTHIYIHNLITYIYIYYIICGFQCV